MDLDHIELNEEMLAGLYGKVLVDLQHGPGKSIPELPAAIMTTTPVAAPAAAPVTAAPEIKPANAPQWKWLGENLKQVIVIVDHADAVHLPDTELSFLTGILGACKLSLADVAIINLQQAGGLDHKKVSEKIKSRITLLFGVEPEAYGLPVSFPAFQIQPFNQVSYLYSPSLSDVEQDKVLKSKLWVCLRRLFNV